MSKLKSYILGLSLCLVIALLALLIHHIYQSPSTLMALLLGATLHTLYHKPSIQIGVDFCSQDLLRCAMVLLGLRIAVEDILQLGVIPIFITLCASLLTIGLGLLISRTMRLSSSFGLMSSIAVAICGASATLAVAASLPPSKNKDVVGASYTMGDEVGEVAVFIKMVRIAMLAPMIMVLSIMYPHADPKNQKPPLVPLFMIGFIAFIALNSMQILPEMLHTGLIQLSHLFIMMALAALGLKIDLNHILQVGRQPLILAFSCSCIIALSSLSFIYLFM